MRIKGVALAAVAALAVGGQGCRAQTQTKPPAPTPEVVGEVLSPQPADPEAVVELRHLLFADRTPEEVVADLKAKGSDASAIEEPWRSFAQAADETKRGRPEEAKKVLRRVLSLPEMETRLLLLAWKGLRELGERPPAGAASEVRGVVCELHNEAGIGVVAAYADGSARFFGGQGKVTIWDAKGADAEVDAAIAALLKEAAPLVKKAPAAERRRPDETARDHFRVSVLTYGGIHVVDVYGPEIEPPHFLVPMLTRSVNLLNTLVEKEQEKRGP